MKEEHTVKGKLDTKKRVVIILARVHGGEQPASFICQGWYFSVVLANYLVSLTSIDKVCILGFLDYLVSSSEKAVALRNGIVIQVMLIKIILLFLQKERV